MEQREGRHGDVQSGDKRRPTARARVTTNWQGWKKDEEDEGWIGGRGTWEGKGRHEQAASDQGSGSEFQSGGQTLEQASDFGCVGGLDRAISSISAGNAAQ